MGEQGKIHPPSPSNHKTRNMSLVYRVIKWLICFKDTKCPQICITNLISSFLKFPCGNPFHYLTKHHLKTILIPSLAGCLEDHSSNSPFFFPLNLQKINFDHLTSDFYLFICSPKVFSESYLFSHSVG